MEKVQFVNNVSLRSYSYRQGRENYRRTEGLFGGESIDKTQESIDGEETTRDIVEHTCPLKGVNRQVFVWRHKEDHEL
jgi:hypothetical protein